MDPVGYRLQRDLLEHSNEIPRMATLCPPKRIFNHFPKTHLPRFLKKIKNITLGHVHVALVTVCIFLRSRKLSALASMRRWCFKLHHLGRSFVMLSSRCIRCDVVENLDTFWSFPSDRNDWMGAILETSLQKT